MNITDATPFFAILMDESDGCRDTKHKTVFSDLCFYEVNQSVRETKHRPSFRRVNRVYSAILMGGVRFYILAEFSGPYEICKLRVLSSQKTVCHVVYKYLKRVKSDPLLDAVRRN